MKPKAISRCAWIISFVAIMLVGAAGQAEEYLQAQAVIGIKTAASGGRYTVFQVARIAAKNGVDIIVTTDAFLNRWQYGLWPLRNIIRKTEETRSVSSYGIRRYLDELKAARQNDPGMVVIGGLEVAPFYYWEGSPFKENFAIKNWHKHLLVIGLEGVIGCQRMPVIGNGTALAKPFGIYGLLCMLLPIAIFIAGVFSIMESRNARDGVYELRFGLPLAHWRYVGIALLAASLILFINIFPFRGPIYDQYHSDRGTMPYQNLIDYVNHHGGMTFWAHPEAKNVDQVGKVSIQTGEHTGLLLETCGYTGFAVFYEGYDMVGRPQGIWDSVLRRYCQGGCAAPVWAIGVLDYERAGNLGKDMNNLRTVLLVKEISEIGALDAMRKGRMYVAKDANAARFKLENFTVGDASGRSDMMGKEIALAGEPRVRIKGNFNGDAAVKTPIKVLLIRDGELLTIFDVEAPFDITYDDKEAVTSGKQYYRAEVRSSGLVLVTNPVFVTRK
jgi:hypothetical protein